MQFSSCQRLFAVVKIANRFLGKPNSGSHICLDAAGVTSFSVDMSLPRFEK